MAFVSATPGMMGGVPSPTADTGMYVQGAKANIKLLSALPYPHRLDAKGVKKE